MEPVAMEYKNRNPSGHWFDADTMRFFRTRIGAQFWRTRIGAQFWRKVDDTWAFVTSEKPPHGERAYSVRLLRADGEIETVQPFCGFTRSVANRIARQLATDGVARIRHEAVGGGPRQGGSALRPYVWFGSVRIEDGKLVQSDTAPC